MNAKDKASRVRQIERDEVFQSIMKQIKDDQVLIFLNQHSTVEQREKAHDIVLALGKIEEGFNAAKIDEQMTDKRN